MPSCLLFTPVQYSNMYMYEIKSVQVPSLGVLIIQHNFVNSNPILVS